MIMKLKFLLIVSITVIALAGLNACKKSYLEPQAYASYIPEQLQSKKGIEALLVGAYAMIDGVGIPGATGYMVGATNWVYADVASDDAYKGSDANDQPQITEIELWASQPTNFYFYYKWLALYDGVARTNDVIKLAEKIPELTEAEKTNYIAEARFLRGHFHFDAKRLWNKVPYISETTIAYDNKTDIWPLIEADFRFAYDKLPTMQPEAGRANKWAAGAYLAKIYMYEQKFAEAKVLYDIIIQEGQTSNGKKYDLQKEYWMNFSADFENSAEAVFSQQTSASGDVIAAAEASYVLAFPFGGDFGCCGFLQPSQNLVNAFKVDTYGHPFLDGSYNNISLKNDEGISSNSPFTNDDITPLDPRLDWTTGRRGISYWDWGPHPGQSWIRDQAYGGAYSPKKTVYQKSEIGVLTGAGMNRRQTAKNYNIIRFADVLLMAAEAEIELGNLEKAHEYINRVRNRTANPAGFVKDATNITKPAANYKIEPYMQPFPDHATARSAVRFERRLELALEGHRFFDLVRWKVAGDVLNAYLKKEKERRSYLKSSGGFTKGKNEYYPIPNRVIEIAKAGGNTLEQNPGY
jgi:hypothetical protein